ncbi:MAG: tetratricopeptide repeat protein, partial [Pseudomonadota bacterium]
ISLASGEQEEFETYLSKLDELAPQNADVLLLKAARARNENDASGALEFAEQAFTNQPTDGTLIAVATYQEANGDPAGAQQRFAQWLEDNPEATEVRMAYANSLQLNDDLSKASTQYALVIEADDEHVIALNNQAWILRETEPEKALEFARKASNLAPNSAEVLDTLAVVEYVNEDYARAQRNIERALDARPDHPSMRYHSAMIAAALNDNDKARETLTDLLAETTEFPEYADAQALLEQLNTEG